MRNILFVLVLIFNTSRLFSQDLIIKKDSTKILCKIIGVDSLVINYKLYKEKKVVYSFIERNNVLRYYISTSTSSSVIKTNKRDSINSEKKIRFHLSAFVGDATPLGLFKSTDLSIDSSGLAKKGITYNASFILKLSKNFGLSAFYINQKNLFSVETIVDTYNAASNTTNYSGFSDTPWKIKGWMGGFYFTFPIRNVKSLYLDFNILVGVPKYTSPHLSLTETVPSTYTRTIAQKSNATTAFTYLLNFGVRYKIYKYICLVGSVDFLSSKPEFTNVIITYTTKNQNSPPFSGIDIVKFNQRVKTLNLKLGLSFTLKGISKNQ